MSTGGTLPEAHVPLPGSPVQQSLAFSESEPEPDRGTFYKKLRIDVREPVGNLSISPSGRDVVLAARKGLFIVDLDHPYESPRFLPQGGTWEVADVQWNPHPARAELIVSTSSQKLLIWNLYLTGKSNIEQILHAHYRAITDINWHAYQPEIIASCGIDSWIWSWDLRQGSKPTMGFCAWNAPATQVKWNRQDENILASSHDNYVLVWDRRKGSVPLITMEAHDTKIYGIDWSRRRRNEIVTCSLDKTIKFWKFDEMARQPHSALDHTSQDVASGRQTFQPTQVIRTHYPVWRARHVPFGHGVLSLPQRGETALELWKYDEPKQPMHRFEGHTNVVKEFVWRTKGGQDLSYDDREFQLITWSKDHTLRGWPIDAATTEKMGYIRGAPIKVLLSRRNAPNVTFRVPPTPSSTDKAALSAPVGNRTVLAGVRATPQGSSFRTNSSASVKEKDGRKRAGKFKKTAFHDGGFMTRGHAGGRPSKAGLDQMLWISSVKLQREGVAASGRESPSDAVTPPRAHSPSRSGSIEDDRGTRRGESSSPSRERDGEKSFDIAQEMAAVAQNYAPRVKFEKIDVTSRTCTISLHGPWLESDSVFLRITFTFPNNYPRSLSLSSTPHVELEKNSALPIRTRAYLLKHLRELRQQRRPCLEACVRFLLGLPDREGRLRHASPFEDDSSSEEEGRPGRLTIREDLMRKLNVNVPVRRGGATFGPNGELVYFYAPPPFRLVPGRVQVSRSPSIVSRTTTTVSDKSMLHEHDPNPLSKAMAGLIKMSQSVSGVEMEPPRRTTRLDVKPTPSDTPSARARTRESTTSGEAERISLRPTLSTAAKTIVISDISHLIPCDPDLGREYTVQSPDLKDLCEKNALVARTYGRPDHERVWAMLSAAMTVTAERDEEDGRERRVASSLWAGNVIAQDVIRTLFAEAVAARDIQILGMLSCLLLQDRDKKKTRPRKPHAQSFAIKTHTGAFSLKAPIEIRVQLPPPTPSTAQQAASPNLSSPSPPSVPSTSSRSSWSSFLGAGASRLLSRNAADTTPPSSVTPRMRTRTLSQDGTGLPGGSSPETSNVGVGSIPIPSSSSASARGGLRSSASWKQQNATQARFLTRTGESPGSVLGLNGSPTGTGSGSGSGGAGGGGMKSQSDPVKSLAGRTVVTFVSEGHRREGGEPTSQSSGSGSGGLMMLHLNMPRSRLRPTPEETKMVLRWRGAGVQRLGEPAGFVTRGMEARLGAYVRAYGELLMRWRLFHRRGELFEASGEREGEGGEGSKDIDRDGLGLVFRCGVCRRMGVSVPGMNCALCEALSIRAKCVVCRVPVGQLGEVCVQCGHCVHGGCRAVVTGTWTCGSGCGCMCGGGGAFVGVQGPVG